MGGLFYPIFSIFSIFCLSLFFLQNFGFVFELCLASFTHSKPPSDASSAGSSARAPIAPFVNISGFCHVVHSRIDPQSADHPFRFFDLFPRAQTRRTKIPTAIAHRATWSFLEIRKIRIFSGHATFKNLKILKNFVKFRDIVNFEIL